MNFERTNVRMSKVDVALVDEHFMHGKVALNLCNNYDCQLIIVVNDALVDDKTQQGLLEMSIPDEINTRFYSIDKAVSKLHSEDKKSSVIIVKSLEDMITLFEAGVVIPKMLLCSLPHEPGMVELNGDVSVSESQIDKLKLMKDNGTQIYIGKNVDEKPELLKLVD